MTPKVTTRPAEPLLGFGRGLADSASLMLGYFPIAVSFGLLAAANGLGVIQALLVSAVVYAGASQFALVSLLAVAASPLSVVGAVAAMNLRHLFYGPALLPRLPSRGRKLPRPLIAFGLTDEVFALASARLGPGTGEVWLLGVQAGAYGAWLAGTICGGVLADLGGTRWPELQSALSFVLPSLFMALLLPLLNRHTMLAPLVAAVVAVLAAQVLPGHAALLVAMAAGAGAEALKTPQVTHG